VGGSRRVPERIDAVRPRRRERFMPPNAAGTRAVAGNVYVIEIRLGHDDESPRGSEREIDIVANRQIINTADKQPADSRH
jgi:hypothetical protein